ncbi:MAG TPA: NUDIX hydrolase [Acetobacteraceae bacterium]|nr:NUDIX hydrolase [Acetobacteraceae bacterium]
MAESDELTRTQYGAVPLRVAGDGRAQILLVTSRGTGRWIVPKGWPMQGLSPAEAAARESFEEAGVVGTILGTGAVGAYRYRKRLTRGRVALCEVSLFLLRVEQLLEDWPERPQRTRQWFAPEAAAAAVDEDGLAAILRGVETLLEAPIG